MCPIYRNDRDSVSVNNYKNPKKIATVDGNKDVSSGGPLGQRSTAVSVSKPPLKNEALKGDILLPSSSQARVSAHGFKVC